MNHGAARLVLFGSLVASIGAGCGLEQAATARDEASAIGSVRAIVSAQAVHAAFCGGSYAPTLPALLAKGYLSADLGAVEQPTRMGYRFSLTATKGDGTSECGDFYGDYEIRAAPARPDSGGRHFRSSAAGDVYAATQPDFSDATRLE